MIVNAKFLSSGLRQSLKYENEFYLLSWNLITDAEGFLLLRMAPGVALIFDSKEL
jgi:hypothetical protein